MNMEAVTTPPLGSVVAGAVPPAAAAAAAPPQPNVLARLLAARGVWALADQAVCSLGNFLTGVLMARGLADPHAFGVYSLTLGVLMFLNSVHGSVVTYPLTLEGAAADPARLRRLVRRGLAFTLAVAPVLAVVILAATARVERLSLLPWAALAMVMWQAQETVRRALLARLRHRDAIPGDAVSFLGQAACVWLLWRAGALTPERAMAGIALTSGLAAAVQFGQIVLLGRAAGLAATAEGRQAQPPEHVVRTVAEDTVAWWRTGRWLLVTCFVNLGTIYLTPWVLEAVNGEATVARLYALNALLNLTNPVLFSLAGLVVAAVAGARASAATPLAGVRAGRRVAARYALLGLGLVVPYYAVVLAFPTSVLSLFYGRSSPYVALAGEVPYVVLIYATLFVSQMSVSLLNGLGEGRASFVATLSSSVATGALGVPLVYRYGLHGALVGGAIPMLVQFGVALWMIRRVERRAAAAG